MDGSNPANDRLHKVERGKKDVYQESDAYDFSKLDLGLAENPQNPYDEYGNNDSNNNKPDTPNVITNP